MILKVQQSFDVVDARVMTGAANGAAGGSSSSFLYTQQTTSSTLQRGENYDSATLRAMGAFSNKGTEFV